MPEPDLDTDEPVMSIGLLAVFLVLAGIAAAAPLASIAVATATGNDLVGVTGIAVGAVAGIGVTVIDNRP
ncbi:hypothetical protein FHS23_004626 [Prauserella isguenensis]|uniref:Uncharacterized protein n=1 Tax=Prauserella isguenensis TaxID=1470180 RepID=A0A839S862_9PSEU|nr:hypothetical protein [Prauserella isguenensis]MBB3053572.1 hypothetical protein [Prauserella isguenensis]